MSYGVRRFLASAGLVGLIPFAAAAQQKATVVSGRVVSEGGVPLVYVDVRIPGLSAGAVTRENGTYRIEIPAARVSGQRVTISARVLGYKPQSAEITLEPGDRIQCQASVGGVVHYLISGVERDA